ncbi:16S rRNA (adenine(1518)-N(6)/adenine(1519)-N(6))-dimethyltransferase RsmA [Pseudoflavonifractor phocaeensis]|uniref:16S rRNA (adenine(1518)-N(6)/adenine(1519)-N(6))- dimethyltransferase RsmA n=1 Tax=Pseudoflavonifractor phocaeensis TaxID=1870988 RepID=UPI001F315934|nr:16S rRNA (adenine(1518)-N(6)/adenine(1519)-N(6))-dimethyltransferase RsmA [Pseudoflavonifractor phocaeensis]MCF2596841.1 ribosomal RNA small subunit methyltransferase A [Pseudoflavonifractor phocaeensis]
MDLCDINQIKALLARHGFRFSKSMGQNFLIENWVPRDIARASGAGPGKGVLEIGPGIGPLTTELSLLADKVVSVELDRSLLPILAETLAGRDNAEIVSGDILKTDIPALVREKFSGLDPIACANLPYNITTPAITALVEAGCFSAITVMIQREVARRICAAPGTPDYGAFSVYCQYHTHAELLFDVPPECFVPAPKVTSSVVRLTPRPAPAEVDDPDRFFQVVKAAFSQRRKTLLNALSSAFGDKIPKEELLRIILSCGFSTDVRGERLGIPEFARLSKVLPLK